MSVDNKELYEFGEFRLDVGEHKIAAVRGPTNGALREKPFQTLVYLLRNNGRLVTKQELLAAVWPDSIVEEGNLGKAIYAIRSFLGEKSASPTYIETVPKHGYRFIAEVRRVIIGDEETEPLERSQIENNGIGIQERSRPALESASAEPLPALPGEPAVSFAAEKGQKHRTKYMALAAAGIVIIAIAGSYFGGRSLFSGATVPVDSVAPGTNNANSPAHDLYIRGKVKVANENREDTEAAIRLLEQAVALDPAFAQAYAQLARAYNTMAFKFSADADRKRYHENAEVAIEKALELNPNLAEGHFARGLILWSNTKGFPHEHAIRSYKRSLTLDPNSDETYHQLSLVYSHIGLLEEARTSIRRALELNPNNTLARFRDGVYLQYQGKFDEALDVFKTIPRDHTPLLMDRSLAETIIQLGRLSEAESIADNYLSRFSQDEGGSFTSVKALVRAKQGDVKAADELMARAAEIGKGFGHFHHTGYNIACAQAALGRPDEAVKWLEQTADNGFPNYPYFAIDPNLDPIREHPGFIQFMAKLRSRWGRFSSMQ